MHRCQIGTYISTPTESVDIDIKEEHNSNISPHTSESDSHRFTSDSDTERDTDNIESDSGNSCRTCVMDGK